MSVLFIWTAAVVAATRCDVDRYARVDQLVSTGLENNILLPCTPVFYIHVLTTVHKTARDRGAVMLPN